MDAKILIVDDEPAVRNLFVKYLNSAGYKCFTADSVNSAKEILDEQKIDLLLSDVKMPGESGIELIRHAKVVYPEMGRVVVTGIDSLDVAGEIMEVGVYGYVVKPMTKNVVLITVKNALKHLQLDLDAQAHGRELEKDVSLRSEKLAAIMSNLTIGVLMCTPDMKILEANRQMQQWFPMIAEGQGIFCYDAFSCQQKKQNFDNCPLSTTLQSGKAGEDIKRLKTAHGEMEFRIVTNAIFDNNGIVSAGIALYEDVTEKMILERDLRQAQKLEAVGQLAAGIAHEINSPIQYVGDNIKFLHTSFTDLVKVLDAYQHYWHQQVQDGCIVPEIDRKLSAIVEEADTEYLTEEIPRAIDQSLDGVRRVEKIVRAMKEFSHPGSDEKSTIDINKIIDNTITVCRNEWKYVAEMETDFAPDLPTIPCFQGDLSQVFLNIIVNAAHAIESNATDRMNGELGKISISTKKIGGGVSIQISDTGGGIPATIQERIFDPFYTTKPIGKGTGQGLDIAYRTVVDKHQGTIFFASEVGQGTTFVIQLPESGNSFTDR